MNLKFKSAESVSTDSRSVSGGQVFFALRGENFNGHDFVRAAIDRGAVCAVVDRKWYEDNSAHVSDLPLVIVENTIGALGRLAQIYRSKFEIPVIAVGGSNGKTTTKEMVARVLARKFKVLKTSGNHNNQIGVPLTILRLTRTHEAAVVEIGTNQPGEIRRLCEYLRPTAGLVTNIGSEHLEFFRSIAGVKKEEGQLYKHLSGTGGLAFVNMDDESVAEMAEGVRLKFRYGFSGGVKTRREVEGRLFGFDSSGRALFEIKYGGKTELVHLAVPGVHNAFNALSAAAVGFHYGIGAFEIKKALEGYRSFEKRMELLKIRGITILNDTYNSNPESAIAALHWLSMVKSKGKRIVAMADMLELGKSSKREHQRVGKRIAREKFDYLFTFGDMAAEIRNAADSKLESESFADKKELSEKLLRTVAPGDVVLVKGSRGMKMEEVVNALIEGLENRGGR